MPKSSSATRRPLLAQPLHRAGDHAVAPADKDGLGHLQDDMFERNVQVAERRRNAGGEVVALKVGGG